MATTRFEKFSESARLVLILAQKESQRFQHRYIGTEHILLGLVRETEGVAAKVLSNLGVDLSKVVSAIEFIIGEQGERPLVQGEIGLTPRSKKVVELAVDEARRMNHTYIGTQHLLIGLLREGEGVAARVLHSLGVTLDNARLETVRTLTELEQPARQEDTVIEAEPDLVSRAQQLVALQEEAQKIEAQIAEIEAIQRDLPALKDELAMKQQKIRVMIGRGGALLPENEPQ